MPRGIRTRAAQWRPSSGTEQVRTSAHDDKRQRGAERNSRERTGRKAKQHRMGNSGHHIGDAEQNALDQADPTPTRAAAPRTAAAPLRPKVPIGRAKEAGP